MSTAIRLFLVVAVACAAGCAGNRQKDGGPVTARWKTQRFVVKFRAGPRGEDGRAFSYYEVSKLSGEPASEVALASAHTDHGFESVTNGNPKNYVRIIEGDDGRSLLIEEDVPNEVGPCKNYLFVFQDDRGILEHKYLRLPELSHGTGGVDTELPSVIMIRGSALTYRYSSGKEVTREIGQIKTMEHPVPPG